ncbi:MAG TPA: IS200/IS605 family transposase [Ignavibacteriales bacterium]|nr:IS200/IS605 family transposase [Ignavibacteriales bacterium]
MPDIFRQAYIHFIFAVKFREQLIMPSFSDELEKYITAVVQNMGNKMIVIKLMPDHLHFLISYNPACHIPDLVREIKSNSTELIKKRLWLKDFAWQTGYGMFTYSRSQVQNVIRYIMNQEEHHRKKSFKEEFLKILKDFEVEHNEHYLFKWICEENKKE